MSLKVAVYKKSYERLKDRLAKAAPNATFLVMDDSKTFYKNGVPCDIREEKPDVAWINNDLFFCLDDKLPFNFIEPIMETRALKWLAVGAHGTDHPIYSIFDQQGTKLTNSDESAIAIPEFVVARVLDVLHPNAERLEAQKRHEWEQFSFREIHGMTWVIYGFGHIGEHIAEIVRNGFGAKVIGIRRTKGSHPAADEMMTPDRLLEAAARADVFVIAVPGGPATDGTVSAEVINAMKPSSILVNVGRGSVPDEEALLKALDKGKPLWAILDVFDYEPLPADSPIWDHPRVRATAHCSGHGGGVLGRGDDIFIENLRRYAAGETLRNVVKPTGVVKPYTHERTH